MKFSSSPKTGEGKSFLKLKDGESATIALRGDPFEFYVKWQQNKSVVVPEGTEKAAFRFRINVVVLENGSMIPKIWEQGANIYNQLKELHDEYDLEKTALKIKRDGTGLDTSYSILPARKEFTDAQVKSIAAIEMLDLSHGLAEGKDGSPMPEAEDEIPF